MRHKCIAAFLTLLPLLLFPGDAAGQSCYYAVCDSYVAFNWDTGQVYGYSRTTDYSYTWYVAVESELRDPNFSVLASSGVYGTYFDAYAEFSAYATSAGTYQVNGEHYVRDPMDWWWTFDGTTTDNTSINPSIEVSAWDWISDGGTGNFNMTAQGGFSPSYSWTFSAPPGAGNDPWVSFTAPSSASTSTDGHWFAYPNTACTNDQAQYTITGEARFTSPNQTLSADSALNVWVPWAPGGVTYSPSLIAHYVFGYSNGLWRVLGSTYFTRTNPVILMNVPSSSQFYGKVWNHELVHRDQFMPGGVWHMNEDLFDPTAARTAVVGLSAPNLPLLQMLVDSIFWMYMSQQYSAVGARAGQAQAEAFSLSDFIPPHYLYQASCQGREL